VTFRQGAKGISLKPNTNETKHGQELLTRVKCFPLYSLLLATNLSKLDYLSLDADGAELQVLRTVPLLRVDINVINVRCHNRQEKPLIDFMVAHNYRLQVVLDHAYIFVHKMIQANQDNTKARERDKSPMTVKTGVKEKVLEVNPNRMEQGEVSSAHQFDDKTVELTKKYMGGPASSKCVKRKDIDRGGIVVE
ncbi:unnamed protein product, partial [Timema podura]|nr:unnamed protein product [Timema podura]